LRFHFDGHLIVVMKALSDAFSGQSLKHALLPLRSDMINPHFYCCHHRRVQLRLRVEKSGMAKAGEDGFDSASRIDIFIGPSGDDLSDGVTDDNFGDVSSRFIQVAATLSVFQWIST
jgi:hypothetical protein